MITELKYDESLETEVLVKGLRDNDSRCYEYLYDNFSSALYGIALRITREDAIAEDVLQETFIKIYKNIKKYSHKKGTLFTWMLNICRNTAIDKVRYGKNSKFLNIDSFVENLTTEITPEITAANSELWLLLNMLDSEHKELLRLSYYYGYSHSEIAQKLNMPFGSVKSKIRIAIRELRKIYP